MHTAVRKPRTNHLDLAQSILDVARQRGFKTGARLPEQQMASACKVSRTPVRAALRLLADRGLVERDPEAGYRLAADLSSQTAVLPDLPTAEEDDLAEAVLRDRAARRLDETVTVSSLVRRYGLSRGTVLKALTRLADESFIERAPGQSWLFRPSPDAPDALAESYDFRLVLEPAAILAPGFQLDGDKASALRERMEALLALHDAAFDIREFQRLDLEFHVMMAEGTANRFLADALASHHKLRRLPGTIPSASVFRLRQSMREHIDIIEQLEGRQFEIAADLLRVHLRLSSSQRPRAANRGAPALFGKIRRPVR